ncbi:hypothetical protein PRVXH_002524 [Proteinivorax hydrogeniformans]|uniref:Uncharacterized protein n=1 Tax=Proteinivorax hydrogeniformans TaxID=1826727 RepID=A0AAU8HSN4_9FIRM
MATIIFELIVLALGFFFGLFLILLAKQFEGPNNLEKLKLAGGGVFTITGVLMLFGGTYTALYTALSITLAIVGVLTIALNLYVEIEKSPESKKSTPDIS